MQLVDYNRDLGYNADTTNVPGGVKNNFGRKHQETAGGIEAVPGMCGRPTWGEQAGCIKMGNRAVRAHGKQSDSTGRYIGNQSVPACGASKRRRRTGRFEKAKSEKKPNLILRANLIKLAIIAQAAFLFNCTSVIYQLQHPDFPNKDLYRGALIFSLILLALSSIWMAANHLYETDKKQRYKNTKIELGYCCVQLAVGLLTIHFGLGLVGAVLIIAVGCTYILYINPKFMFRKLTR